MTKTYTATAKQNPGRQGWIVEFRHPLRRDNNDKPGKKVRKGLGTTDAQKAAELVAQVNELLASESLWSVGARSEAAKRFESAVLDIFYDEIEPRGSDSRPLRDQLLPLPGHTDGYARVVLMGVPGAGKTTLVRQLIGTDPITERFPSTSVNRTTTFPTELVLRDGGYEAVVTFMSEHEARFEVEECVSAAVLEAVEGRPEDVARALLEKSDMRFRLKYLLGDPGQDQTVIDPYEDELPNSESSGDPVVTGSESDQFSAKVQELVARITLLATESKDSNAATFGPLEPMKPEDRTAALDLIQEDVAASDKYVELVSDILDELRTKFELVSVGRFEKTTTGWPRAWTLKSPAAERESFLVAVRYFCGINCRSWGKLLTPLVNGLRAQGPFRPKWAKEDPRLVLIDTEGLGHKANATADLPEQTAMLLHEANIILLVDNAKNGMTSFAAGKALESVVNGGHSRKLAVVFTHMETVKGDNLLGAAKLSHVFLGLRNVIDNQLAKSVSPDAASYLLTRLERNTFYVGRIDERDPVAAQPELEKLLAALTLAQPAIAKPRAFPEYSDDNLVLAIHEAARDFREQWQGRLGLAASSTSTPAAWQSIKALSRRYAEGWGDHHELRPASNLYSALASAVSRFLENPLSWSVDPSAEEKRETIDRLKAAVTMQFRSLSRMRLREGPQPAWHDAWALRGARSTIQRRIRIEGIYAEWVPIPDARGDRSAFEFMNEVKVVVRSAIDDIRAEVTAVSAST